MFSPKHLKIDLLKFTKCYSITFIILQKKSEKNCHQISGLRPISKKEGFLKITKNFIQIGFLLKLREKGFQWQIIEIFCKGE